MLSPYGMEIVESCLTCKLRADRIFCDLPATALRTFEKIKCVTAYPQGAVLFVEGQMSRGIFVLCRGTVKLSLNSPSGRTMIVELAEPGELLGLSATISAVPIETPGFPKKMDRKEGTGRSTADDGNRVVVLEAS